MQLQWDPSRQNCQVPQVESTEAIDRRFLSRPVRSDGPADGSCAFTGQPQSERIGALTASSVFPAKPLLQAGPGRPRCEKCREGHDGTYGSGRFCSQSCAFTGQPRSKRIGALAARVIPVKPLLQAGPGRYRCENCREGHDGSYGSGRFCSQSCRSKSNGKKFMLSPNAADPRSGKFRPPRNVRGRGRPKALKPPSISSVVAHGVGSKADPTASLCQPERAGSVSSESIAGHSRRDRADSVLESSAPLPHLLGRNPKPDAALRRMLPAALRKLLP